MYTLLIVHKSISVFLKNYQSVPNTYKWIGEVLGYKYYSSVIFHIQDTANYLRI